MTRHVLFILTVLHIFLVLSLVVPVVAHRARIMVGPKGPQSIFGRLWRNLPSFRSTKANLPRSVDDRPEAEAGISSDGSICCWSLPYPYPKTSKPVTPFNKKSHCHFLGMIKAPSACCDHQAESGLLESTAPPICFSYDQQASYQKLIEEGHLQDKHVQERYAMLSNGPELNESEIMSLTALEIIQHIETNDKGHQVPDEATFKIFLSAQNHLKGQPSNLQDIVHGDGGFVFVIGDIHAQLNQVLYVMGRIANIVGDKFADADGSIHLKCQEGLHYVFLGDYLDRGDQDIEVLALLLAYRAICPSSSTHGVLLLRGNHEDLQINRIYGFEQNWKTQYPEGGLQLVEEAFLTLPYAAFLNDEVFLVHGGLPVPHDGHEYHGNYTKFKLKGGLTQFKEHVNSLPSVMTCGPEDHQVCHMMWSDPDMLIDGRWKDSPRGGYTKIFGSQTILDAHDHCGIKLIIRGHQVPKNMRGYFGQFKILTVFTAANYCNSGSIGAFLEIRNGHHLQPTIHEHYVNTSGHVVSAGDIPWEHADHNMSLSILRQSLRHGTLMDLQDAANKAEALDTLFMDAAVNDTLDPQYRGARPPRPADKGRKGKRAKRQAAAKAREAVPSGGQGNRAGALHPIKGLQLKLSAGCAKLAQYEGLQKAVHSELANIKETAEVDHGDFAQRAVLVADEIGDAGPLLDEDRRLFLVCFSEALLEALKGEAGVAVAERSGANVAETYKEQLVLYSKKVKDQKMS